MVIIPNQDLLQSYITQYALETLFESDISGRMSLFYCQKGDLVCGGSTGLQYLYFLVSGN